MSPVHTLIREPTVIFLTLALTLFLLARVVDSRSDVIEIDRMEVERRIAQAEAERGAPLDPEQQLQVEEDLIYERILAREARRLVLEEDPRIQDLLVQSMLLFLRSEVVQPPTESELLAYYEGNRSRYASMPMVTLDDFLMAPSTPPSDQRPAVLRDDVSPDQIPGNLLIRHRSLARLGQADVARLFDAETARLALQARAGEWIGPYRGERGDHWLRLREKQGGEEAPAFDSVLAILRQDWILEREQTRLLERVADLRERYTIRFTDP